MRTVNFDAFQPNEREIILKIQELLIAQDFSRIQEHIDTVILTPTGVMDSEYFARPSAISLLIYGIQGLQALYHVAITSERLSVRINTTIALLCSALQRPDIAQSFVQFSENYLEINTLETLKQKISVVCKDIEISNEARRILSKFLHHTINDPVHQLSFGSLIMTTTLPFVIKGKSAADELLIELLAKSTLNITDEICEELEELISQDLNENIYQDYLRKHPSLLDPLASSIVDRQYLAEVWKTDFVIRRLDNEYIFVEIEKPQDKPFTDYPHPSAALAHALGQVINWFIWIEDNIAYAQTHGFYGIHMPKGIIIIGRRKDLKPEQIRILKAMNDTLYPRISILTYDDIIQNSRNIVRNLTSR